MLLGYIPYLRRLIIKCHPKDQEKSVISVLDASQMVAWIGLLVVRMMCGSSGLSWEGWEGVEFLILA